MMIDKISSRTNKSVVEAFKLKEGKGESFLVEGFHMVEMAYKKGCLEEVFALIDPKLDVKTHLVTKEIIAKLSSQKSPEGIIGVAKKEKGASFSCPRVLLLDKVQDPGNVGTILRSALCFGFMDILFLPGTCSPFNQKALQASQGAIFSLNIIFPSSEEEALSLLEKEGYSLFGSALKEAISIDEIKIDEPKLAVILGNEGKGMSPSLLKKTKANLYIPISSLDSLNVAVAGGILMRELAKK